MIMNLGFLFFAGATLLLVAALRIQHKPAMSAGRLSALAAAYGAIGLLHGGFNGYRMTTEGVSPQRWLHVLAGVALIVASVVFIVARNRLGSGKVATHA
jgi:drug/metabolite transporter superfamily protein YnfA